MKAGVSAPLSCLLEKKGGFTYEYFHGPALAPTQGLAQQEDSDMKGVVKSITYGDLWADHKKKDAKGVNGGPPNWLLTAYEGLAHFH
mmetsp:Transcript_39402/g.78981  ORF Transcript_39402/g.78981 Transcript_39402/m.78981 type:complete len:87 (+) Transcript_39402:57-317(+)